MSNILDFLENNYIWFLVAAAVLLFALVGFIVDSKRKQKKMEGNFENTPDNNMNSMNEIPSVPLEGNAPAEAPVEQPVTEEVKAPFEPVTESPEVLDLNVNNANDMTFNDIPQPQEPVAPSVEEATIKEEIIEPFNIGTPVEAPNLNANTEPVVEQPVVQEPVVETPINETEPTPVVDTNVTNEQEPVVNIPE